MNRLAVRAALAFSIPVLAVFALSANYYLVAAPLSGIVGGFAFGRRVRLPIVLGLGFATVGFMFSLQDARSAWFSDVVWTAFVSGFLFWVSGGCAMLALPPDSRFNGA